LQRFTPYQNDETRLYEAITRNINTALTILFSVECVLKLFGFGPRVNLLFFSDIERKNTYNRFVSLCVSLLPSARREMT